MSTPNGPLNKIGRFLKELGQSPGGRIVGTILKETPVGKVGRIVKGAAEILGVDPDDDASLAVAFRDATPEQRIQILELAQQEREAELEAATARHATDMLSDSTLSKNIRPSMCIAVNAAAILYSYALLGLFAIDYALGVKGLPAEFWENDLVKTSLGALWGAAGGYNVFYIGSRGLEKNTAIKSATNLQR